MELTFLPIDFKLPDLPKVTKDCLHYIDEEGADTVVLSKAMTHDKHLCKTVIMVANNPVFLFGDAEPTNDLLKCIVRIGYARLRHIFYTYALNNCIVISDNSVFNQKIFIKHSSFVSLLCYRFTKKIIPDMAREAQIAGLLHDVGLGVLTNQCPDILAKLLSHAAENSVGFSQAERDLNIQDHGSYSAQIAENWFDSRAITLMLEGHNHTSVFSADLQYPETLTVTQVLIEILNISDRIAHGYGFGFRDYKRDTQVSSRLLGRLGIRVEDAKEIIRESIELCTALNAAL